ncbi:MAG: EscU/YscU/HrcU family type III secretion system export apparatus switch protein [Alkaliphilus sp.]|nr:EscU/YscU/HrcU family type III secretion system export apparatus switch protein [Alkaliphilus sp.]
MKKKLEIATAIKYNSNIDTAPIVLAKGQGAIAQKILEVADESNIKIYKDEKLAKQLMSLSIGQEIPPHLYQVVAEILAFVINLDESGNKDYVEK